MSEQILDGTKMMYHTEALARWRRGEVVYPVQIEISPTQSCNHKCSFCYYEYTARSNIFLEDRVWERLLKDCSELGTKALFYSGEGEPLLHKRLPDMVELGASLGLDQALNTNATALTDKPMRRILPHLEWMRVSMNGIDPDDYARVHVCPTAHFELALRNVEAAANFKRDNGLNVTIGVQFVYTGQPLREVAEFTQRIRNIGVDYFSIKPGMPHPDNPNFIPAPFPAQAEFDAVMALATPEFQVAVRWGLREQDWKRPYKKCLSLPFFAEVTADGKVYACGPHLGEANFCYGSLSEKPLATMWSHENRSNVEKHVCGIGNLDDVCMPLCRLDQVNRFLWNLENPPSSVNFI
jgi:radical SAM protein with 4Fe4S-binding SPASM domain